MKILQCYVDGGCTDNGGLDAKAYGSYKVYDVTTTGIVVHLELLYWEPTSESIRFQLPPANDKVRPTNNTAEALSMQMLFNHLIRTNALDTAKHICIYADSELTINQTIGVYQIKNPRLKQIHKNTWDAIHKWEKKSNRKFLDTVELRHVPGIIMKRLLGH